LRKNNIINRILMAAMLCILTAYMCLPGTVNAAGNIYVDADTSLKINYKYNKTKIPGAEFSVYRVADVSESGQFTYTPAYEGSGVELIMDTSEATANTATKLVRYINKNNIVADMCDVTDENGFVMFPSDGSEMTTGLYLVTGTETIYKDKVYNVNPTLVALPTMVEDSDVWQYSVTIIPKAEDITDQWPHIGPDPEPTTTETTEKKDDKLPQTGQNWWPVPILVAAGLVSIIIGVSRRRNA